MFKSCGKIIFWQKLYSLRQAMPWCVSFRRDGFQRDFPYGASNQAADSFWTWHYWCMNQGSEGYKSMQVVLLVGVHGSPLRWCPNCPHTCLDSCFPGIVYLQCAPSKTCAHSAVHFTGSCPELNFLSLKVCH